MPRPFIFSDEAELIFRSGKHTTNELMEMFHCHRDTIYRNAVRLGVELPRSDGRRYKPNDHYFKTWSIEMAYVLGLLAADGHVTVTKRGQHIVVINLKESDRELIDRIKQFLAYPGPIHLQPKSNGETQAVLRMTSKEMVNDLKSLGLHQNKTYDLKWPEAIPEDLVAHFVRGYFDGDGCVHYQNTKFKFICNMVGTNDLLKGIKQAFELHRGSPEGHIQPAGAVAVLYYHGRFMTRAFLDWIYQDSTPETRLSRKYNIYQKFLEDHGDEEKLPNNSTINWTAAKAIRMCHQTGMTVASIATELDLTEALVHDVVQNRSWIDENYHPVRKKGDTMVFEHEGRTGTLTEWSEWTGVPKNTIDRRLREGKLFEQAIQKERFKTQKTEVVVGRAGMTRERATEIRQAYKDGMRGKVLQDAFELTKSQYIDLVGNRVWKEPEAWWKDDV